MAVKNNTSRRANIGLVLMTCLLTGMVVAQPGGKPAAALPSIHRMKAIDTEQVVGRADRAVIVDLAVCESSLDAKVGVPSLNHGIGCRGRR
jgi:hypothetical protein